MILKRKFFTKSKIPIKNIESSINNVVGDTIIGIDNNFNKIDELIPGEKSANYNRYKELSHGVSRYVKNKRKKQMDSTLSKSKNSKSGK